MIKKNLPLHEMIKERNEKWLGQSEPKLCQLILKEKFK